MYKNLGSWLRVKCSPQKAMACEMMTYLKCTMCIVLFIGTSKQINHGMVYPPVGGEEDFIWEQIYVPVLPYDIDEIIIIPSMSLVDTLPSQDMHLAPLCDLSYVMSMIDK